MPLTTPASRAPRVAALGIVCCALLGSFAVAGSTPALAHDQLVDTRVVTDAATGAPEAIELTFSNSIIDVGTEITILGTDGAELVDGPPTTSGPAVQQDLIDGLPVGTANAAWRVVSSDGHPIEGAFGIEIDADGTAQIVDAAAVEPNPRFEDATSEQQLTPSPSPSPLAVGAAAAGGILVLAAIAGIVFARSRRSRSTPSPRSASGSPGSSENTAHESEPSA